MRLIAILVLVLVILIGATVKIIMKKKLDDIDGVNDMAVVHAENMNKIVNKKSDTE